jgi:hypothetical protein
MTKLGYPLLPVIVRAEPDLGTGMSRSIRPSLATTTLGVFIALCLVSPFCVIGFGTLGSGGKGTKYSRHRTNSAMQQSLPADLTDVGPAADTIDDRRTDPSPVPSSSPGQSTGPPDSFTPAVVVTEPTDLAAKEKGLLPHSETADGPLGAGKVHRRSREETAASRRSEQIPKGKTARHRGKSNPTANRASHGPKRRAALSEAGSGEDRDDQADRVSSLASAA